MIPGSTTPVAATPRSPISYGEPQNTLTRPEGEEHQLVLSEGPYPLRDVITLGPVPPPPGEQPLTTNMLDPRPLPPTAAPHLSIANLGDGSLPAVGNDMFAFTDRPVGEESPQKKAGTTNGTSRLGQLASGNLKGYVRGGTGQSSSAAKAPASRDSKELIKRKKPKASMLKSNSSMIARAHPHDALSKRLQEHKPEGHFAFVNNSRAFLWLDLSSPIKAQQLVRILFARATPLCHAVNPHTKAANHLDVVMGFSSADILWYEPMSQKYSHLNKNGIICPLPVVSMHWYPPHENLFLAAHVDGTLIFYDKEKDDAPFTSENVQSPPPFSSEDGKRRPRLEVRRSLKSLATKNNPIGVYKATRQRVKATAFSSDGRFLAIVSEDGSLRIVDLEREELIDLYTSYFGGIHCVAWSPDNRYILTGGEDDQVSIWSFEERSLIARCRGHRSWVTDVRFDRWRCDETNYRFASVGEDRRLLLWDFSTGLVQRPRAASMRPSVVSLARPESAMASRTSLIRSIESPKLTRDDQDAEDEESIVHPVESRAEVATLPPVLNKVVDEHTLASVNFTEDAIIITCSSGHIQTYDRPKGVAESEGGSTGDGSTGSAFSNPFKS